MHEQRIFKTLVLVWVSTFLLTGFREKFLEKNQAGSPKVKKLETTKVKNKTQDIPFDLDEEPITLDVGPASEDRKKFDVWYSQLEENIRSKRSPSDRVEALHLGLSRIERDRNGLQNLKFNEEIEIDFMTKPLRLLPKVGQFNSDECSGYRNKILSHFDPTSDGEVKDPALKKALGVFKLLCAD